MAQLAGWTSPFKSFDAAALSSSTNGAVLNLDDVLTDHAVELVVASTSGDAYKLTFEGSLDGTNWVTFVVLADVASALTETTRTLTVTSLKPAQYLRVVAVVTAGTPTVTALLVSRP